MIKNQTPVDSGVREIIVIYNFPIQDSKRLPETKRVYVTKQIRLYAYIYYHFLTDMIYYHGEKKG